MCIRDRDKAETLTPVEGNPPSLLNLPPGCPFVPRCPMAVDACRQSEPDLVDTDLHDHLAACIRSSDLVDVDYYQVYPRPQSARARSKRALELAEREALTDVLELDGLVKTYPLMKGSVFKRRVGTVHAVDGISFRIKEGETLGLVGESGCGKTTTIMSILELAAPEDGRVVVLGKDTRLSLIHI